jgi:nitrite reductase/ring-hydroxylating ferredoxin subunit
VEDWARRHFPIGETIYRWSGQVIEPMDGLAFIGRNAFDYPNIYIVTGDSGNGMTHCSLAGLLISDLINGIDNPWTNLYSPYRFTIKESGMAFKQMMKEILGLIKRSPASKQKLESIRNGEANVIELMGEKYGVYRDDYGTLNIVSAKCTHLGCTITWNKDELSWDCPCHGSRYTYDGKVVHGPANTNLAFYSEHQLVHKEHE